MLIRNLDVGRREPLTLLVFFEEDPEEPIALLPDRDIPVPDAGDTVDLNEVTFDENNGYEEGEQENWGQYRIESRNFEYELVTIIEEGDEEDDEEEKKATQLITSVELKVTGVE